MTSNAETGPSLKFAQPAANLRPWIACYWYLDSRGPTPPQLFLPGLSVAWIFSLGASGHLAIGESVEVQPQAFVKGPFGIGSVMTNTAGARNFGIAFKTGGASAFLPMPLDALSDGLTDLTSLETPDLTALANRVCGGGSFDDMVAMFDLELTRMLARAADPWMGQLLLDRHRRAPDKSVRALASTCGLSERQFRRLFRDKLGSGPTRARRIGRIRHAASLLSNRSPVAEVAHACGFTDQAHLTKEFRTMVGWTPSAFQAAPTELMAQFGGYDGEGSMPNGDGR